jgi:hypothetical protein
MRDENVQVLGPGAEKNNGAASEPITLTLDDLLKGVEVRTAYVDTSEWKPNSRVKVRGLTIREMAKVAEGSVMTDAVTGEKSTNGHRVAALYAFYGIINENGKNVFTKQEHLAQFENLSFAPIMRIFQKIGELGAATEDAKEELEKNSETTI